jgi:hypothetical protein
LVAKELWAVERGVETMRRVLVASAVLGVSFLAGCSIVGGGIAGAGYDPVWQVRSAEK